MYYQELGGSPQEQYDQEGFSARREFLVPWENRERFAEMVFGTAATPPNNRILTYPGRDRTIAYRMKIEPVDPRAIDLSELDDIRSKLPQYKGSWFKAVINYKSISDDDRTDIPNSQPGTWIAYRMKIDSLEEPLELTGWKWSEDPALEIEPGFQGVKRIPITEHIITWNQVVGPPWNTISQMQGKVNSVPFIGCEPGTLLFDGAEGNKLYRKGDSVGDEPSPYTWMIQYVFREKTIKFGNKVYGWNHFYRKDPVGWDLLLNGQKTVYDSADFNSLFTSETTG